MTPSEIIIAAAKRTVTVTDELGRAITVRRMNVSHRLRFMKVVPAELQTNPLWLTSAMTIASVIEIDGVPTAPLLNELSVEQAGDLLGDEGLFAANQALADLMGLATTPKEALAAAGEQPGTPDSEKPSGS